MDGMATKGKKSPSPHFSSPPIVDINGDHLYDSGLMIKQAALTNQAKYI